MKVLVTGGPGFIGSHTCVELLEKGYEGVIFDNLYNSKRDVVDKIEKISGKKVVFYEADMLHKEELRPIFEEHKFDAVIHFAGLKAVGESVQKPLEYYQNNLDATLTLCKVMARHNVSGLFSRHLPRSTPATTRCRCGRLPKPAIAPTLTAGRST